MGVAAAHRLGLGFDHPASALCSRSCVLARAIDSTWSVVNCWAGPRSSPCRVRPLDALAIVAWITLVLFRRRAWGAAWSGTDIGAARSKKAVRRSRLVRRTRALCN